MKLTKLLSLTVAAVMAVSTMSVSVFAEGDDTNIINGTPDIQLTLINDSINIGGSSFGGKNVSATVGSFKLGSDYNCFKVWIENTSSAIYKVNVRKDGDTSTYPLAGEEAIIKPHDTGLFYSYKDKEMEPGYYFITIKSLGSSTDEITGSYSVRVADNPDELGTYSTEPGISNN